MVTSTKHSRIFLTYLSSQHDALLKTAASALKPSADPSKTPCVLVFYSHHRPHLAHRDMEFFSKAREQGWTCDKILTEKFPVSGTSAPLAQANITRHSRCFLKILVRRRYGLRCTGGASPLLCSEFRAIYRRATLKECHTLVSPEICVQVIHRAPNPTRQTSRMPTRDTMYANDRGHHSKECSCKESIQAKNGSKVHQTETVCGYKHDSKKVRKYR